MTKHLSLLLASTTLSVFLATSPAVEAQTPATVAVDAVESETDRLNIWFDSKFEEVLAYSPIRQTALGRKTAYGELDDFSDAAADRQLAWRRAATEEMKDKFDYDKLTADGKISWDMWLFRLAQAETAVPFRSNAYVLHHFNGTHAYFPTFLINQHRVETEADMLAFISRLEQSARALDQLLERSQNNAKSGTRPPRFSYEEIINQAAKITAGAPFSAGEPSAIWKATLDKIAGLVESKAITESRAAELREMARTALTSKMQPAYARIIDWFESDLPNSDAEARGVSALNNGAAFYNYRLASQTTTNLTADEIHNIGLSEVARIRGEMVSIKDKVGFEGDLQAFFTFLREDDQFYFSNDDKGAQDYIDAAKKHLAFINTKLPEFFGTLPKADLEVRRVEPFREQDGAAQHYRVGTPDGSRPGVYYAHLSDMRAMPIHSLEVIAYHEGNPGHHMQSSIAQELTGIPKFRAQGGYIPAFGEGWGLYSEYLAKEMGAYADPYSDFGRLTTEMWRAIRLVVDTGLHAKGWSQEQAVQYFLANSPIPETAIRSEVKRYLVMPGQATSYKIGMLRIQQLRAKAEKELGDDFDIRAFHDTVLGGGSVPLSILEKVIDQWIAKEKAS